MKCGCYAKEERFVDGELINVGYCSLHALAPEMLEVVRGAANCTCDQCLYRKDWCGQSRRAKAILAKLAPPGEGEVGR